MDITRWTTHSVVAFIALLITLTVPPAVQAQQVIIADVMLVTGERGMVDSRAIATKDIVTHMTSQRGSRTGMHIVMIRTCPNVPRENIQAMMKDMEETE